MKGRHVISITSRRANYSLALERKISVIKGRSGTGKSSVIRLVTEYLEYGKKSGIKLVTDSSVSLAVLTNTFDWARILPSVHNTILFFDEDVQYIYSEGFQKELWRADCYAVIVSRSAMFTGLPYAISSIYELITERKGLNTVTSMYRLYEEEHNSGDFDLVLTEDSNSGYEMAKYVFESDNTEVITSGGNAAILQSLQKMEQSYKHALVDVDGTAFGVFIEPVLKYAEMKGNILIAAPESFEYVILNFSNIRKYLSPDCGEILRTYDYCDSAEYSTWEKYYEQLLENVTSEHLGFVYNKRKLNPWFLNKKSAEQFIDLICHCFVKRRD